MRLFRLLPFFIFSVALIGCGQKGPLYLAESPPSTDSATTTQNSAESDNEQPEDPNKKPETE